MPARPSADQTSDYRLATAFGVRFVGSLLIVLAVLLLVATIVVAVLDLPTVVLVVAAAVGVLGAFVAGHLVTWRVPVVRLTADGYRVRLIRGVGVAAAGWREVEGAATDSPGGVPVVVLRLSDGRRTTIPVEALAADREEFVRDLQRHLQQGQGLRRLDGP